MPLRASFDTLWGDEKILNQVNNLHDLALYKKAHPNETLYKYEEPEYLMEIFLPSCYKELINNGSVINREGVKNFIKDIETLSYDGEAYETWFEHGNHNEVFNFLINDSQAHLFTIGNTYDLLGAAYSNAQKDHYTFKLFPNVQEVALKTNNIFAINASSQHQDIAKEILLLALSEEEQYKDYFVGLPVQKKAAQRWFDGEIFNFKNEDKTIGIMYHGPTFSDSQIVYPRWSDHEGVFQDMYHQYESISKLEVHDKVVLNILLDESADYYSGSATLEETTSKICDRLDLYLSEQKSSKE